MARLNLGELAPNGGVVNQEMLNILANAKVDNPAFDITKGIAGAAAQIPVPEVKLAAGIVGVLTSVIEAIFGTKPCKPKVACPTVWSVDGRGSDAGVAATEVLFGRATNQCCMPQMSGYGVVFTEHTLGYKRWPGYWDEVPAGDYDLGVPGKSFMERDTISMVLIPEGWAVRLYNKNGYDGQHLDLGPGAHNLTDHNWNDSVKSVRVRGFWTNSDVSAFRSLMNRESGWATASWPEKPTVEEVRQIILNDPFRPIQTSVSVPFHSYESGWRPGWEPRMQAYQVEEAQKQKELETKAAVQEFAHKATNVGIVVVPAILAYLIVKRQK